MKDEKNSKLSRSIKFEKIGKVFCLLSLKSMNFENGRGDTLIKAGLSNCTRQCIDNAHNSGKIIVNLRFRKQMLLDAFKIIDLNFKFVNGMNFFLNYYQQYWGKVSRT